MNNLLSIVKANLQKGKGQAVTLLVFVLISALLMNLGLLLMIGFGNFFEEHSEALNAPHLALLEEKRVFDQAHIDYLKNYPGVTDVEHEQTIAFMADFLYGEGKMPAFFFLVNASKTRTMNDLTLIEGTRPQATNDVCLPYLFKAGGYSIGDDFVMTVGDRVLTYTITGFTDEILFGSINNQTYQLYVTDAGFKSALDRMPEFDCMLIKARFDDPAISQRVRLDCINEFYYKTSVEGFETLYTSSMEWVGVKSVRTLMSSITSLVLVIFSALIILVSLLVIRFRIRNTIEESMTNIGALKAVGYTGRQLLWATVLQFCAIALVGIVIGIAVSYALLPVVSDVLEQQTSLQWIQGFDPLLSTLAFFGILFVVFIVSWATARRIQKLHPLVALRQGLSTHSFERNHFPLEKTRGPLSLLLAAKSAFQAKGQMVMITIIVTVVSFMAVAGLAVYDNLGLNSRNFAFLLAGEIPDAAFMVRTPEDAERIMRDIKKDNNVRKAFYNQDVYVMTNNVQVRNVTAEDFGLFEGAMLYEGQYPRHSNEICVSGALAAMQDLAIGDSVRISLGGNSADFLIVGLIQSVNNYGFSTATTIEGLQRVQASFRPQQMFVYLEDTENTAALVDRISKTYDASLESAINMDELMVAQLSMYGNIFFLVAVVLLVVTALVILLVLYLMMRTVILRRRRELGIKKALGFTTLQLMNQLALYFVPAIFFGVALGGVLGALGFNPLFVAVSGNMGIMSASMPTPVIMTVIACLTLVVISYAFALLIALRIRRISAYTLVTE
ncbi:MAG: ABC transporter permease [Coriobacteriales bacterium]|jgi:putative ABC transport system permease protein|nr:ABC transporter permease [Coriobacteriales bacterium]